MGSGATWHLHLIIFLKNGCRVHHTCQRVGGTHTPLVARVTHPFERTSHVKAVTLDASCRSLYDGKARYFVSCMVELRRHVFFAPSFFLFNLEKCVTLAKNQKGVLFIIFIIFGPLSFSCIKLHLFFQLHALAFDFYIKFVFLFYNVSGLTFNV